MRQRSSTYGVLATALSMLLLCGCATAQNATGAAAGSTALLPVSASAEPPPPANNLTTQRIDQIADAECPGAITRALLHGLSQYAAEAASFLAGTNQCSDIARVLEAFDNTRSFVSPLQYIDARCTGATLLSVWAHYDDDLIFGSPTIPRALEAGECVRNLYLTGSDAGKGLDYAYAREAGLRAAYDEMRGAATGWQDRTVTLMNSVTLTMTQPVGDPRITLFLLRLPDGGLDAGGFASTGHTSLPQLLAGSIDEIDMIVDSTPLTRASVISTIVELSDAYQPTEILTHLPGHAEGSTGDHPDHAATGNVVMAAADAGQLDGTRVTYAQGYPSENRPANVSGDELTRKLQIFAAYAANDSVVHCSTAAGCLQVRRFGDWLSRQYVTPHNELLRSPAASLGEAGS